MFKTLMSVRMVGLLSWFTGGGRSKKPQTKAKMLGFAALMVYVGVALGFMFFTYFSTVAEPFRTYGLSWLYFALYALLNFAIMFIGSVFTAKSQLFEARDNDLLLAMPIRPAQILASRMGMLLITNLVFGLPGTVSAFLAWSQAGGWETLGLVSFLLITLLLPFFSVAVSSLFAWLLSLLTARVRNKSLFSTVFSLAFLAAYFYAVGQANNAINALVANGAAVAERLGGVAPLYWLGSAMANGSPGDLLLGALCLLLPFCVVYWLLSRTFIRTATTRHGFAKIKYEDKGQKVSGVSSALFNRELRRFLTCSAYLLNSGLGAVFTVVGAVVLVVEKGRVLEFTAAVPMFGTYLIPIVALALCGLSGMTVISAPSVSLEGKSIWIAQSLPVPTRELLRAKLQLHLRVALPPVALAVAAAVYVFRPKGLLLLGMVILPLAFTVFEGLLGLWANLRHPSLDWTNETQAVKSGMAIFVAMFGSWGILIPPVLGMIFLPTELLGALVIVYAAVIILLCRVLHRWIMTRGCAIFAAL